MPSDMLQRFIDSMTVSPASREEWESFDLPALHQLAGVDRAEARQLLVDLLDSGSTDSRVVDALLSLRDDTVWPHLHTALERARRAPPSSFVFGLLDALQLDPTDEYARAITEGDWTMVDFAAPRFSASDPVRARPLLRAALATATTPDSRTARLNAWLRALGLTPDYRTPSRIASLWQRAGGWPPSLTADVLARCDALEASDARAWSAPLPSGGAFDAWIAALASSVGSPGIAELTSDQLDYLAARVLNTLVHASSAGLSLLVASGDPAALPALDDCLSVTWLPAAQRPLLQAARDQIIALR